MATLPTLPTEYVVPLLDTTFAGYNAYVFDTASSATAAKLRDFLRGISVSPWGTLTRPAVIHLDPAIDWVLSADNTDYFFVDDGEDQTDWLVITTLSGNISSLPVPGERVRPTDHTSVMPKLRVTFINTPTIGIDINCDKVRFLGLEITHDTTDIANALVFTSRQLNTTQASTVAEQNEDIIFDRLWLHAQDADATLKCRAGIELNVSGGAVIDSYIERIRDGSDTQAIWTWHGDTHLIENNYLEATGENYLTGGTSIPIAPTHQPTHIVFRRNLVKKRTDWNVQHPDYAGVSWTIKNLFETKIGQYFLIEGNVFQNSWFDDQTVAIVLKAANQPTRKFDLVVDGSDNTKVTSVLNPFTDNDATYNNNIFINATTGGFTVGSYLITSVASGVATLDSSPAAVGSTGGDFSRGNTPWVHVTDLTFRRNIITDVFSGIHIIPTWDVNIKTDDANRWLIEQNFVRCTKLIDNNGNPALPFSFSWGGALRSAAITDITIRHNTCIHGDGSDGTSGRGAASISSAVVLSGTHADQVDIRDNIFHYGENGVVRTGTGQGTTSMNASFTNYNFDNNLMMNGNIAGGRNEAAQYTSPALSFHEDNAANVGFVSPTDRQWRLLASSDYAAGGVSDATDGTDLGVDWDLLEEAIRGVVSGLSKDLSTVLVMA